MSQGLLHLINFLAKFLWEKLFDLSEVEIDSIKGLLVAILSQIIESLSTDVFEPRMPTGNRTFSSLG